MEDADGGRRAGDALPVRLWILALPRRRHDRRAAAALQAYIAGWGEPVSVRVDDWWLGLDALAEDLRTSP